MPLSFVEFFEGTHYGNNQRQSNVIVDETFFRLMEGTSTIERLIPATSYVNSKILLSRMSYSRPTIASIVAPEQEIPNQSSRMTLDSERIGKLKIAKQRIWKENDYEMLRELDSLPASSEIAMAIKKHFLGTPAELTDSIYEKSIMLAIKIAITGECIFEDPLTGAEVELSYNDRTFADLMPAPLTGTNVWTDTANAQGLVDLELHARAHFDRFGMYASDLTMREPMIRMLKFQDSVKVAALARRGASQRDAEIVESLYLADQEVIDLIKDRTKAQNVETFDAMYSEEQADGAVIDRYYLDDNYYFFSMPGNIERAFIPTVERNFQAGIYTRTKEISDAPKIERTVGVGNCAPFCRDARKLAARRVA